MACGRKNRLRKRTKPYAGCKTAPAAFLEAAKTNPIQTRPARLSASAARLNAMDDPCRRLALKELRVCEAHGGFGMWPCRESFSRRGRTAAFRAATVEGRSPPAPLELTRLPLYREANERTRMRLVTAWQTPAWHVLVRQIQLRNI